jgi:hypothetical protein
MGAADEGEQIAWMFAVGRQRERRSRLRGVVPGEDGGNGSTRHEINRSRVRTVSEYNDLLAKTGKGKSLLFRINRGPGSLFLAMKR